MGQPEEPRTRVGYNDEKQTAKVGEAVATVSPEAKKQAGNIGRDLTKKDCHIAGNGKQAGPSRAMTGENPEKQKPVRPPDLPKPIRSAPVSLPPNKPVSPTELPKPAKPEGESRQRERRLDQDLAREKALREQSSADNSCDDPLPFKKPPHNPSPALLCNLLHAAGKGAESF